MSNLRRLLMANAMNKGNDDYLAYALLLGQQVYDDVVDYTEEHPNIIPYLKGWKYLIHSIVATGYTSWLKGDGVAYIDTKKKLSTDWKVYLKGKTKESGNYGTFFGSRTNDTDALQVLFYGGSIIVDNNGATYGRVDLGDSTIENGTRIELNIDGKNVTLKVNGNTYNGQNTGSESNDLEYCVFARNNNGTKGYLPSNSSISVLQIDCTASNIHLVPCYNSSTKEYGMLDLNADNAGDAWYGNASANGMFTWSLTDEDDNVMAEYNGTTQWDALTKMLSLGVSSANFRSAVQNYTFVDYAQNTGNSNINTNVVVQEGKTYAVDILSYIDSYTSYPSQCIIGAYTNYGANLLTLAYIKSISKYKWYVDSQYYELGDFSGWVKFEVNHKGYSKVNGSTITTTSLSSSYISEPLKIFTRAIGVEGANEPEYFIGKIKYLSIYEDEVPLRIFIPCVRKSDSKNILVDILSLNEYEVEQGSDDLSIGCTKTLTQKMLEM